MDEKEKALAGRTDATMFGPISLRRDERRQRHRVADQGSDGDVTLIVHCLAATWAVALPARNAGECGCSLSLCLPSALSDPPLPPIAAVAGVPGRQLPTPTNRCIQTAVPPRRGASSRPARTTIRSPPMPPTPPPIRVNRASVLSLWATVVAERLGYPPETALTLGRFVAGSSARANARRLGISDEKQDAEERHARAAELNPRRRTVRLLGRDIPVLAADDGTLRAEDDGKPAPGKRACSPTSPARSGTRLAEARAALPPRARAAGVGASGWRGWWYQRDRRYRLPAEVRR
jgi:hypothetical protein